VAQILKEISSLSSGPRTFSAWKNWQENRKKVFFVAQDFPVPYILFREGM
jgi:hypothetical protein